MGLSPTLEQQLERCLVIGPFIERDDKGFFKSLVVRELNVETRTFVGWYMKYDAELKILEISERLDDKLIGLQLIVKIQDDDSLVYEERVKTKEKG